MTDWKPENGEMILVGDKKTTNQLRQFIGMWEGRYVVVSDMGYMSAWTHAAPIPEEPWTNHNGTCFPACRPDEEVKIKCRNGKIFVVWADDAGWVHYQEPDDILRWRRVK